MMNLDTPEKARELRRSMEKVIRDQTFVWFGGYMDAYIVGTEHILLSDREIVWPFQLTEKTRDHLTLLKNLAVLSGDRMVAEITLGPGQTPLVLSGLVDRTVASLRVSSACARTYLPRLPIHMASDRDTGVHALFSSLNREQILVRLSPQREVVITSLK